MSNVLLGSYQKGTTVLHKLDARVKIICLLLLTVAIFAASKPWALGVIALGILVLIRLANITLQQLKSAVKPTAFILALSLICNMFAADGTANLVLVGSFGITFTGLARGLFAVSRILVLIALALVLTTTTSSTQIAEALTSLLNPLAHFGLPVGDIAMTVSVALRFIPLVAEELVRVRDAQRIRGVRFDEGSVTERLQKWLSVLTPLVVALFRNADDLAKAMRERCYKSAGRTHFTKQLSSFDIVSLVVVALLCIAVCFV